MTEQAISCILIVGFDSERFQHISDCPDNFLTDFIFDHALLNRNHSVRSSLIGSADYISFFISVKYSMYFISIIKRIIHSNNRFHIAIFLQKLIHIFLFDFNLLCIRDSLILTTATFFPYLAFLR